MFLIDCNKKCLKAAQDPIGAPVLCQLNGRAHQVSVVLLQFLLKLIIQRKGICRGPGKAGYHLAVVQTPHL